MIIEAVGIDAAFANMGFAQVVVNTELMTGAGIDWWRAITCKSMQLVSTSSEDQKVVRKSSDHLRRAQELHAALQVNCRGQSFAFVEVPSGTQSSNAAFGLGIAVGVLASCSIPILEVNPMEVKAAVAGHKVRKGASKAEVIAWATQRWPDAPWLRVRGKKEGALVAANEHLADALATVVAGIKTPEFNRLIALHHAVPNTNHLGSSPNGRTRRRLQVDVL